MTARSAVLQLFMLLVGVPCSVDAQSRARGRVPSIVAEVVPGSFSRDTDGLTFSIMVQVPPNHHGYLDNGDDGFLIPFTFSFPTLEEAGVRIEEVSRPAGVRDEKFRAQVLRGRAEFRFRLVPAAAITSETSASLRYQICNDLTSLCYRPNVVRIPIARMGDANGVATMSRIWDEKLEADPGYDESWSIGELIGSGPIMDEDATPPGAASTAWGSQSLQIVYVAGENSILFHDFSAAEPILYSGYEFIVTAESLANGEANFMWAQQTVGGAATLIVGALIQNGLGQLQFRTSIYHDGSANDFDVDISLNALYRVEYEWDSTADTWEWWLDGVSQNSGTLTGSAATAEPRRIYMGAVGATVTAAATVYFDQIAFDDGAQIGADLASL